MSEGASFVDPDLFSPTPQEPHEKKFIQQISEARGIQSCYPTSILNGWINQEALTYEEALGVQNRLYTDGDNWFGSPIAHWGAVMISGFDTDVGTLIVVDPRFPTVIGSRSLEGFANDVLEEGWITLVKKFRAF